MINKQQVITILTIQDWVTLHQTQPMESYPTINDFVKSPDWQYKVLQQLLTLYKHKSECEKAVEELHIILSHNPELHQPSVYAWVSHFKQLGTDTLFGFLDAYFIEDGSPCPNLYITELDLFVKRNEFLPIIQFCKAFDLLYWNGYGSPPANNTEPIQGYYSLDPLPPERDIEQDQKDVLFFVSKSFV